MPTLVQHPSTGSTTATVQTRRPVRRLKIVLAVLAALLLHAGLIVLLAWALPHWPRPPLRHAPAPIQLMVQPADPAPTPGLHKTEVVPPPQPEYIRTNDNQKKDSPPPDPQFISSTDTEAVTDKTPEDRSKPLPTQDGKERESFEFMTNPYIAGKEAHDNISVAAPAVETAPTHPPDPPKPEAQTTPRPANATPTPAPGDFLTLKPDASPSNSPPEPSPSPTPPAATTPPPPTRQQTSAAASKQAINSTGVQQPPGYQPQTVQTKMAGSIDNHGKITSVAARGTPLGRYEKAVSDAIGARWYFNVEENMSTLIHTGEVKIHFVVTRSGKIINTRITNGKRNENTALADISVEAVMNAEVPPIPSEVAATLPEGQLEGDLTFEMF